MTDSSNEDESQVEDDDEGGATQCDLEAPHTHLLRLIFRLPSYLPLPDGTTINVPYPEEDSELFSSVPVPFALVRLHNIQLDVDTKTTMDMLAADLVVSLVQGRENETAPLPLPPTSTWHTVADVITTEKSPDGPHAGWDGQPQNLGPRQDAVMRALGACVKIARSVRMAGYSRVVTPTYERLPPMLFWMTAVGPIEDGLTMIPEDAVWDLRGVMMLEHTNIEGWEVTDSAAMQSCYEQSGWWSNSLDSGSPAPLAREFLIECRDLLHVQGEYSKAVVAASTAVEVLCDSVLSALLWEESYKDQSAPGPGEAAQWFQEGGTSKRVTSQVVPRLKGDWSSKDSAWQRWHAYGASLRNRTVHGGHQVTRHEAARALECVDALQTFIFDRLAARANDYPRSTLMLVARSGLEKRNLYRGRIKDFNETTAQSEEPWMNSFGEWHQTLISVANQ